MKRVIPFFAFVFLTLAISAQTIEMNPNPKIMDLQGQNLSDFYFDFTDYYAVSNLTDETVNLRWRRLDPVDCPAWDYLVCDNVQCYDAAVKTNIGANFQPAVLQPNETVEDIFSLHVLPRSLAGCCTVFIEYYLDSDPTTVIETMEFNVSINETGCFVSTSEEVVSALRVFPNPMTDYFQLDGNDANDVRNLVVYNLIGRQVRSFDATSSNRFDMSGLPGGIYLVGMVGAEGEILKTVRLSRQVARP